MTGDRPQGPSDVRVLLVERRLYEDGGARSTIRLVQQWLRARVPVQLFVLQRPLPGQGAPVPPEVVPLHPLRAEPRLRWALLVGLVRLVPLARRADVVVSGQQHGFGLLAGWVVAAVTRRPFAIVVRAAPGPAIERGVPAPLRPATRLAYRTADRIVCISPGLVPAVLALGVRRQDVSVALNGVEVDRIRASGRRPATGVPQGPGPLVVGIGRLEPQKGFDLLIRAHARVRAAGAPHRLLLLGEGPERAALEDLAATLGVAGSVHLPGFVADPLPTLARADLFCLPSRYEGFGQSLAEALILGTPTVAADCVAGPSLLLADGAHGDLVPVEDVDALAAAIERHLRDPDRLRAAVARGQAWAVEHLSIERAARDVLAVLADVAAVSTERHRAGAAG